ncbi:ATP-dependent RNA helicase HrpA [Cellulomonas cellasea]|uniref:ATP-dependent RNA helicase HrpA n=1 Tax=Cellulomonas cellasea TaxID=43670 RepID=UPI0025A454FB|nr:ATP-dependent RNA helicase HrpA [Cellulomonas cellasea]MDM8085209.1 ATP-dependent RNA helicase HrpA [Cellulomonas cellasea]
MSTAGEDQPRPEGADPGSRPARRRRPPRRRPGPDKRTAGSEGDTPQAGARTDQPRRTNKPRTDQPRSDKPRDDQPRRDDPRRDDPRRRERRAAARRAAVVPPITYPEQLPVSARRDDIAAAIRDHQVVIVAGETGSGKTTQLPKIVLDLGRGREGQIGHTQPRRIAARTVAERIADELGTSIGELVGYQVRFTDESSERTLVKVMTDGILLAQIQRDPMLRGYDTLIIDEAHERSLNIDFLLGYLTRLLPQRPDLKLIITSATIDSERFARHFAGPPTPEHPEGVPAPVIEVTGRTYPVEVRYRPLTPDPEPEPEAGEGAPKGRGKKQREVEDRDPLTAICEAFDELAAEGPGDILVFFSGEREIRDAEEALRSHLGERAADLRRPDAVEILPLYGRLSSAEQHRVFQPHGNRRVVLATNVAETSLTVPGIRYVIDPGTARISRYSKATKVQRLPIEPISQASANQRSGRCGRVADGIAIRLYSHEDFESRPEFTEPEILRTSLASVILQMIAVGVATTPDDIAKFPFVDPPDTRAVRDGTQLLTELGALGSGDEAGTGLTKVGRDLAQLPMDPRLGRMIVEAGRRGVAREVMIIAAALSIQDPRERPMEQRAQADQQHARFADPTSDFLTYLNLWQYLKEQQRELSGSAFRRMCKAEHLNYLRIREWQDVVTQLRELAKPLGIVVNPPPQRQTADAASSGKAAAPAGPRRRTAPGAAQTVLDSDTADGPGTLRLDWDADRIHMSLLAGLLSQIGMQEATEVTPPAAQRGKKPAGRPDRRGRNEYIGARGARFAIFPGSALAKRPPAWIMAGELVETSRLWARDAARIQPEWAEELAQHLVKRVYSEPSWSTKQGAAMAMERVLLYGVPIVAQRRVLYAKHDPEHARELFIRHALVEGEWTTHHEFFHENRRLLKEAESLEARARRRDLVVDDEVLFAFYDERIPADVVSARHFDTWWKTARRSDPDLLTFTRELLVADDDAVISEADFPATWPQGDLELPLTYQFEPGTDADGVTVHIPLVLLARVRPDGFGWMVPGLREELVTATIRALPKPVRVQLVPAPDVARGVVAWFDEHLASWEDTVRAADLAPSFHEAFAQAVRALRDVEVPEDAFDDERLPAHLRMTFRVEAERGQVVEEGKDLIGLQRRLAHRTQDAVSSAVRTAVRDAMREVGGAGRRGAKGAAPADSATSHSAASDTAPVGGGRAPAAPGSAAGAPATPAAPLSPGIPERTGLTTWPDDLPDGALPLTVETSGPGGLRVRGYPALVEEPGGAVALRVMADPATQVVEHRRGLRRLLLREVGLATPRVTTRWSGQQALTLAASPYPSTEALVADVQLAAVDHLLAEHLAGRPATEIRTSDAHAALRAFVRDRIEDTVHRIVTDLVAVLGASRELDAEVRASTSMALLATLQDVREQAARLVHVGFVSEVGASRLPHLARYLRAARHRLSKAAANPDRDASMAWTVAELTREHATAVARAEATATHAQAVDPDQRAALDAVRWMIEELRVSLFAQQLGTDGPVSEKRIRKALAEA